MREIEISKPATYKGIKVVEINFNNFDKNGEYDPIYPQYKLKQYKDDKMWYVFREVVNYDQKSLSPTIEEYVGKGKCLRKGKEYVINLLKNSLNNIEK